jgi:hypothetical protein
MEKISAARYLFGWQIERDSHACSDFSPIFNTILIVRFEEAL